jgi:CDP-glucose 4,6-dehydratase
MEDLAVIDPEFWLDRSVFITGHTGFKGAWLSLWLSKLGARVHGFSLAPTTEPNFFDLCRVVQCCESHTVGDVRDRQAISSALASANPSVVFHLAAQPLVRESYRDPVFTLETNILGVVNVLEIARSIPSVRAVLNITTDKCYENRETHQPYREGDSLGGHDIYSASKACSEIISSSYRRSFLALENKHLATARAGNVIGGGDWSLDRLLPDFFRAVERGECVQIRSPKAIRPWQHVLQVLWGYVTLAQCLHNHGERFSGAWNLGPDVIDSKPVQWIMDSLCAAVSGASWKIDSSFAPHEAELLSLDSSKARDELGWRMIWNLSRAISETIGWHEAHRAGLNMYQYSLDQIDLFMAEARENYGESIQRT